MKQEVLDCSFKVAVFEDTIEDIIASWQKVYNEYVNPTYHTRHQIVYQYYGYDGGFNTYLKLYRLETDEEEQEREEKERIKTENAERKKLAKLEKKLAEQARKEAEEKAEYERLKQKYGE